jgi:hypothetical protein
MVSGKERVEARLAELEEQKKVPIKSGASQGGVGKKKGKKMTAKQKKRLQKAVEKAEQKDDVLEKKIENANERRQRVLERRKPWEEDREEQSKSIEKN